MCSIRKILTDDKYWNSDKIKASEMYKSGEKRFIDKFGDDPKKWIEFAVDLMPETIKEAMQFNENLKNVVYGKMVLQIVRDNVNRLSSKKQAQK
jgi:hypothetical protein